MIVLIAVRQDETALKFAAKVLLSDPGFMLAAVQYHWRALEFAATDAIRSNTEIVAIAASQDWKAMQFAAKDVRSNPEIAKIMCATAQQDGLALQFVPDEFQQSKPDIVLAAVTHTGLSLKFCASESSIAENMNGLL